MNDLIDHETEAAKTLRILAAMPQRGVIFMDIITIYLSVVLLTEEISGHFL